MNNAVFENILENVRKHKEEETIWCQSQIIIVQSFSHKDFLAIEMKKTETLMNKTVYLGLQYWN